MLNFRVLLCEWRIVGLDARKVSWKSWLAQHHPLKAWHQRCTVTLPYERENVTTGTAVSDIWLFYTSSFSDQVSRTKCFFPLSKFKTQWKSSDSHSQSTQTNLHALATTALIIMECTDDFCAQVSKDYKSARAAWLKRRTTEMHKTISQKVSHPTGHWSVHTTGRFRRGC